MPLRPIALLSLALLVGCAGGPRSSRFLIAPPSAVEDYEITGSDRLRARWIVRSVAGDARLHEHSEVPKNVIGMFAGGGFGLRAWQENNILYFEAHTDGTRPAKEWQSFERLLATHLRNAYGARLERADSTSENG